MPRQARCGDFIERLIFLDSFMETYNILSMDISYYELLKNHLYNVYGLLYMAYVVFTPFWMPNIIIDNIAIVLLM